MNVNDPQFAQLFPYGYSNTTPQDPGVFPGPGPTNGNGSNVDPDSNISMRCWKPWAAAAGYSFGVSITGEIRQAIPSF